MAFVAVRGIDKVMTRLNMAIAKIEATSLAGLIQAAIIIRRDMDKTPPVIPIDFGNLRASWFIVAGFGPSPRTSGGFKGPEASKMSADHSSVKGGAKAKVTGKPMIGFGFSAYYANIVHEEMTPKNWQRPGSGPLFLERSVTRNYSAILMAIANSARLTRI